MSRPAYMRAGVLYIPVMGSGRPYWDFPRGLGPMRMLLEVGGEWGVPARACLAGTGLSLGDIDRTDLLIEAEQAKKDLQTAGYQPILKK